MLFTRRGRQSAQLGIASGRVGSGCMAKTRSWMTIRRSSDGIAAQPCRAAARTLPMLRTQLASGIRSWDKSSISSESFAGQQQSSSQQHSSAPNTDAFGAKMT
ncbi:hypothetical protein KCP78_09005 [Salmonella enterica subsp. enterica]|nr:hypothetical protein KCP78_09005 [Salmonella enterica subsp. enterica]